MFWFLLFDDDDDDRPKPSSCCLPLIISSAATVRTRQWPGGLRYGPPLGITWDMLWGPPSIT